MNHYVNLNDDTSEALHALTVLTGLTIGELIDRFLSAVQSDIYELLALVHTHPELHEQAANLLISFGPEPCEQGIKRIAPSGYRLLSERFESTIR